MTTSLIVTVGASFLASCVEVVEAFTVILAVGVTRNWRSSLLGALAATLVLAALIGIFGITLASRIPLPILRGAIGSLVLIFGLNWLRKAILRAAGIKDLHDERKIFAEQTDALARQGVAHPFDWLGFTVSLKSTLLEGLEVAFIVITFGLSSGQVPLAVLGAASAVLVMGAIGLVVRKPLERIPENTLKLVVGLMLSTFGTFWVGEGLGINWPLSDLFILPLLATYLSFSWLAVRMLTSARTTRASISMPVVAR